MNKSGAARAAAALALVLTFAPLAWMLATSAAGSLAAGRFLMDLLMIAELSPLAFAGALLSALAARLSGRRARRALAAFAWMALPFAAAQAAAVARALPAVAVVSLVLYHVGYALACAAAVGAVRGAFARKK